MTHSSLKRILTKGLFPSVLAECKETERDNAWERSVELFPALGMEGKRRELPGPPHRRTSLERCRWHSRPPHGERWDENALI